MSSSTTPEAAGSLQQHLASADPTIAKLIEQESHRQADMLEMIASENHTSVAVMEAVGSLLTNKYCEGYPGKRYYSGCDYYDEVETLAIQRACELFGCSHANVQPHSGANANTAVFFALLEPGDTFASIVLSEGGHLTHGSSVNISGKWFKPVHYPLVYDESRDDAGYLDYDAIEALCMEHKPKLLICGYSAYPRTIDFPRFRQIADKCGAILMADIAHIAGLVAAGEHPSPFPHCHVVTTTTHKTLRGPRGGLILTNDPDMAKKFDKAVFPGTQGGPLMHVIAGKAVCFAQALTDDFKAYARQTKANAQALATALIEQGFALSSGGTDNHLVLLDLRPSHPEVTGKMAADWLEAAGIIVNKNTVPNDERSPFVTSGLRIGTPALATRGMVESDVAEVAQWISQVINSQGDENTIKQVRKQVSELTAKFALPH